ncbi:lactose permease [Scheffersomyces amazonensis]|uniref:lactose permease n=1 Tax=Scheffersomyces amazonensis TaxID=1078765 RepID=UPI00315DE89E
MSKKNSIVELEVANVDENKTESSPEVVTTLEDIECFPVFSRPLIPLLGSCFLVYFVSTTTGFDGSLMSSIYTQDDYLARFNLDIDSSTGTGLVFSIYNIAQVVAAFFCPLIDYLGRKKLIMVGCLGIVVGGVITAVAQSVGTLIAGRFFLSFFTTLANSASSLYVTEIAPPNARARVAGCYNTLWYCGSILAAFTAFGANRYHAGSELSFRLPLGMQCVFPGIVVIFGWLIPESPRWLVGVGKVEEAKRVITKYHCNGDETHPLLNFEIAEIQASFEMGNLEDPKKLLDLRPIFKNNNAYRSLLVIGMAWFGQFSGNNCNSYYLPTMLRKVGIKSISKVVLMNAAYSIMSWVASIAGALTHEMAGRRKMFMFSTLASATALAGLAVSTARYMATEANAASQSALAFVFLFGILFSFGFTPMQVVYPAEVSSNALRSRSFVVLNIVSGAAQFINQFVTPTAMKNISYWFYVFYVFFDIFEFLVVYFFFVETKGKTLEEMDEIFAAKNPRKASVGNYEDENEKSKQAIQAVAQRFAQNKAEQNV